MTTDSQNQEPPTLSAYRELIRALEASEVLEGDRCVLVVDDEPSVRRMVSRSLTSTDSTLKIYPAENGEAALDALQSIRRECGTDPVLIVSDLQMPVMDGWELIDRLWAECEAEGRTFGIPVIVLSSSSGAKGGLFGASVHGRKVKYRPMITVAKEDCIQPGKYDAEGEKGLLAWVEHFLRPSG